MRRLIDHLAMVYRRAKIQRRLGIYMAVFGAAVIYYPQFAYRGDLAAWSLTAARAYGLLFLVPGVILAMRRWPLTITSLLVAPFLWHTLSVSLSMLADWQTQLPLIALYVAFADSLFDRVSDQRGRHDNARN